MNAEEPNSLGAGGRLGYNSATPKAPAGSPIALRSGAAQPVGSGTMTKKTLISLTFALLPIVATAQGGAIKGDAKAGEGKTSACIGCHAIPGYKASFPSVYSVPKIAGQSQAYLAAALTAYQKGDRSHPTMRAIAGSLSEQDIADLAAYYASR
jgi:cytochrome c553